MHGQSMSCLAERVMTLRQALHGLDLRVVPLHTRWAALFNRCRRRVSHAGAFAVHCRHA